MLEHLRRFLTRKGTREDISGSAPSNSSSNGSWIDYAGPEPPPEPEPEVTVTDEGLQASPPPMGPRGTSVRAVQSHLATARNLFSREEYSAAMDEILAVLDVYPKNAEALSLAESLLYLGLRSQAKDRISPLIREDPLLDSLFNQCNRCHACWPFNPVHRSAAGIVVTNPVGGRCPSCGKVWCRTCAQGSTVLSCPQCGDGLEVLREPTGRKRGLRPLKHPELNLVVVFVFKAPPEPRNRSSYLSMVLDALCPDVFHSKPRIYFEVGPGGEDQTAALIYSTVALEKLGIDKSRQHTFTESFKDGNGPGVLVTVYEPR